MRYTDAIQQFVNKIETELGADTFDWIDGPAGVTRGVPNPEQSVENNSFRIDAGLHTDSLSELELDALHEEINAFADTHGVSVEVTAANPDSCVYSFFLHAMFLGSHPEEIGNRT